MLLAFCYCFRQLATPKLNKRNSIAVSEFVVIKLAENIKKY